MAKTQQNKIHSENQRLKKTLKVFDWAVIIVLTFVGFFIVGKYLIPEKEEPFSRRIPDKGAIKVELFGGCGKGQDVLKIAELLREMGVDVVDIKQESGYLYPSSLIVDRVGNATVAESLAYLTGLPDDRIILQRYELMVDATIVVGLDYLTIIKKLKGKYKT
ncbi:LytR C-terminal domain-containing protein [bacterium]|nr:LytR C-terminal domain-containing protein [bacterium]